MKGRRQAVMQTRIQSNRRAVDEVHLDPDKFQSKVSWDFGQPHRTMVVFNHSKRVYFFLVVAAFVLIWVVGWAIVVILRP